VLTLPLAVEQRAVIDPQKYGALNYKRALNLRNINRDMPKRL